MFEALLYIVLFVFDNNYHTHTQTHTEFFECNSFGFGNIVFVGLAFSMLAISYLMALNVSSNALRPNLCVGVNFIRWGVPEHYWFTVRSVEHQ